MTPSSEEEEARFLSDERHSRGEQNQDQDPPSDDDFSSEFEDYDVDDDEIEEPPFPENHTRNGGGGSNTTNNSPYNTRSHSQPAPPHQRSQAQLLSFGPPYYGRPPTPLPPSPSLTSLLRPSRPTTPDASDDEHGHGGSVRGGGSYGYNSSRGFNNTKNRANNANNNNNNNNSDGTAGGGEGGDQQQHHHRPVPRASPEVPTYEYYGFVLYLFSSCCFLMYLLWSYLPSPFLHALGIHYYPDRWWSLAVPSFIVVLLVYIYVALALYNIEYLTLPLGSLETIVDDAGKIAVVDGRGRIVTSEARRRNLERERERREGQYAAAAAAAAAAGGGGAGAGGTGGGGGYGGSGGRGRESAARRKASGNGFVRGGGGVDWRECWNEGTDAVMDVPLAGVCEILYGGVGDDSNDDVGD